MPLDDARAGITARTEARAAAARAIPGQLAGRPPGLRRLPAPDPGPIPGEIAAVRELIGCGLEPVLIPLPRPSPRGTLPDPAGPILSPGLLRTLGLGQTAIETMAAGTVPEELLKAQDQLRELDRQLSEAAPASTAERPAPPQPPPQPLLVQDEPLPMVQLTAGDRALLGEVAERLRTGMEPAARQVLGAIRRAHAGYPGGSLDLLKPPVGEDLLPGIAAGSIGAQADELEAILRDAPDRIDAALAARRQEAQRLSSGATSAVASALAQARAGAIQADGRTRGTVRAVAAATVRAVAGGRGGTPRVSRTQAGIEAAIAELREPVAQELARLDEQLRRRLSALEGAIQTEVAAVGYAEARDLRTLQPGAAQPGNTEAALQLDAVRQWAQDAIAQLQASTLPTLQADAQAQTEQLKTRLKEAATLAMSELRKWGQAHTKDTDTWWAECGADLDRWSTDAAAQAKFWESEHEQASRLELLADLDALHRLAEARQAGGQEAARSYLASLDGEARDAGAELIGHGGGGEAAPDYAGALLAGIRERVRADRQHELEPELDRQVLALDPHPPNFDGLIDLLSHVQPGLKLADRADAIRAATHRLGRGHDEDAIFEALSGLTPLAARLLPEVYRQRAGGETLESALRGGWKYGHLSDDEMRTAHELLRQEGDRVDAAVGRIRTAIAGAGADISAVNRALRSLTAEERSMVRSRYKGRYHDDLESDLRDQWSLSHAEVEESLAILANDIVKADTIALGAAVHTRYVGGEYESATPVTTIDREQAQQVFARIEAEEKAEGEQRDWTSVQVHAAIVARNQEVLRLFDEQSRNAVWAVGRPPGITPSQVALTLPGAGGDLLQALAVHDERRADLARIQIEDAGIWASDKALQEVFREQNERSQAEVNRDYGPILAARRAAKLRALGPMSAEDKFNKGRELEVQDERRLDALADQRTRQRMEQLGSLYQEHSGRSLAEMVRANMSGVDAKEAKARIEQGGVLSPNQQIQFAIDRWRTDVKTLRSVVGRMTEAELADADVQWRKEHNGQGLVQAIEENTHGRDQDDLVDMAFYGRPTTAKGALDAAVRKYNKDRKSGTRFGQWLASTEAANSARDVADLQRAYDELHGVKDGSSADARRAETAFGLAVDRANDSIERQRQAVDSWSDALANIAAITTAVVVGALLTPFTGGASAVVATAVISSIAATAVSMGVKALVKGGAYGKDEFYTDLAIGGVDALVSGLTAGLGHALLGPARGLATANRSLLFRALMRLGAAGRAAARAQIRTVEYLSRFGTQGLLVRGLERRALLGGLAQSERWVNKMIASGAAQMIEAGVQAVPSQLAGALADPETLRSGPSAVLRTTLTGTVHSVLTSAGISAGLHVAGHAVHLAGHVVNFAVAGAEKLLPTSRPSPAQRRLAAFHKWQVLERPGGTMREFTTERNQRLAEQSRQAQQAHDRAKAARRELLAGLPPAERGRYAGIPVADLPAAEFARLPGDPAASAQLVVREGTAVVVLRKGAPAAAAAAVLPEVRRRVLAGTRGMTVEGALPPALRDTPALVDTEHLTGDEIRVTPVSAADGSITGVELRVGPDAHWADVMLHADEIRRWRRWVGLLGQAREALAHIGRLAGLDPLTPRERSRFEAAGELEKLGPLIEQRIRRLAGASDARTAALMEGQVLHQLAQLERARRIFTGEVAAEPRGYVAMADTLTPSSKTKSAKAVAEIKEYEEKHRNLDQQIAKTETEMGRDYARVEEREKTLSDLLAWFDEQDHPTLSGLTNIDVINKPEDSALLQARLDELKNKKKLPEADMPPEAAREKFRMRQEQRAALRQDQLVKGVPVTEGGYIAADVLGAFLELKHFKRLADVKFPGHTANLNKLRTKQASVADHLRYLKGSGQVKFHVGVLVSGVLQGQEPTGGWRVEPRPLLKEGTPKQKLSQRHGEWAEVHLANYLAEHGEVHKEYLAKWGAPPDSRLADTISVDEHGNVRLWDTKYRSSGEKVQMSDTFTHADRLENSVAEALNLLYGGEPPELPPELRDIAIKNVEKGNITTFTASSKEMGIFHHIKKQEYVGGQASGGEIAQDVTWKLP